MPRTASAGFTLAELLIVVSLLGVVAALAVSNLSGVTDGASVTVAAATLETVRGAIRGAADGPGYLDDMRFLPGFRAVAMRTHDLLDGSSHPGAATYGPDAGRGWRGPYLRNPTPVANTCAERAGLFPAPGDRRWSGDPTFLDRGFFASATSNHYARAGDLAAADPWGNPVVIQTPPPEAFADSFGDAKRFRYARLVSAGPDGILQTPRDRLAGRLADGTRAARGDDLVLFLNRADVYEPEER